ncbi:MAG: OmpH family outer membrane protein, partial [Muribaculaceae bacterium]|nr:OmpH family outer membrane protein [Muribaculaceae bacterium]
VNNLKKKQTEAANLLAARHNSISTQMAERQKVLQDSLESYMRDLNATRHYDAVLLRESGVYFNPALDITQEVIAGLNSRYTPAAKAE